MHTIIWEFRVPEALQPSFERTYGRNGDWARLFANGEGFMGTELLRDRTDLLRYLTIDRWRTRDDYDRFIASFGERYEMLDRECERLTIDERRIGAFDQR